MYYIRQLSSIGIGAHKPYVCDLIVVQIELEQHWQLAKCAAFQYTDVVVL